MVNIHNGRSLVNTPPIAPVEKAHVDIPFPPPIVNGVDKVEELSHIQAEDTIPPFKPQIPYPRHLNCKKDRII